MRTLTLCVVAVSLALGSGPAGAEGGEVSALVTNQRGEPLADAVVLAFSQDKEVATPVQPGREEIDQINQEFVPHIKSISVGSAVDFPNKDNIRHHVYSFSPAKTFELPLYAGRPAHPVVFDRPGVVTIGCNVHDWMVGHIYVADTPHVGKTGADGRISLTHLPPGRYAVRVWHPRMVGSQESTSRSISLDQAGVADVAWQLTLKADLRPRRAPVPGQSSYR